MSLGMTHDITNPKIQNRKKKASCSLREKLEEGFTKVGLLGQPSGKFDYIDKYSSPQKTPKFAHSEPTGWNNEDNHHNPPSPGTPLVLPCYRKIKKVDENQRRKGSSTTHMSCPIDQHDDNL